MVAQDLAHGVEFIPGLPPLRPVRVERVGGMLDTVTRRLVGPSVAPIVWYVGERQCDILLRRDPRKSRTLLYSAEGGGKTVLMSQWLVLQVLALLQAGEGGAIGATAPTHERLQTLVKAIGGRVPLDSPRDRSEGAWGTYYTEEREIHFASGHVLQLRSTKKQSEATGSPIQGFTWKASGDDELQDTAANGADPDIEMRLRGARNSFRMCTATAKDDPFWRTFRDRKQSSPNWLIERIRYDETPFIWPEHWERAMQEMSDREWQRRGLALDVGPERMVYTSWDREKNLAVIPDIGAEDVTAEILRPWGPNLGVLVGHDPGKLVDVSILLKAYRMRGQAQHVWFVVDELTTKDTTTEAHVAQLVERLQDRWQCNEVDWRGNPAGGKRALVRADPYSDSGNDSQKPDRSVYTVFRRAGLQILPAAMVASTREVKAKSIPKDAGIDMVKALFKNAKNQRRLFISCDKSRIPCAPRLVEAIELSERDGDGDAEVKRKGKPDLSHWCAALRYALWSLERPRLRTQSIPLEILA